MKEVVTKDNYKRKVLGRMITVCWALLLICFVVKIFGGNFFAFIGESKVVDYIETNKYLLIIFQFVLYMIGTYPVMMTLHGGKHCKLSILVICIMFVFKQFIEVSSTLEIIATVVEFIGLILIPIILKNKWYKVLGVNILIVLFQIISMITKNISVLDFPYETVVGYVYMIDYYIMLYLMWLYSKKGEIDMGKIGIWFLSTDETQLNEYKKHLEAKKAKKKELIDKKYNKKIAAVDTRLEKVNSKKN